MASPAFWSVYVDPMFALLREAGLGCHVAGLFMGIVGYADDLRLLAPCREAAQKMLEICQQQKSILFSSAQMTILIRARVKRCMLWGNRELPSPGHYPCTSVDAPYPGLRGQDTSATPSTKTAQCKAKKKRAQFIDSTVKIRKGFSFAGLSTTKKRIHMLLNIFKSMLNFHHQDFVFPSFWDCG